MLRNFSKFSQMLEELGEESMQYKSTAYILSPLFLCCLGMKMLHLLKVCSSNFEGLELLRVILTDLGAGVLNFRF